jgi:protein-disulfide isomerase
VAAGPVVERIMKDYDQKVRLVIKFYPYKYRDFARISAEAALAAYDQGKFWEMHRLLLKRSPQLDRTNLIVYAKEIGLDADKFRESLDQQKNEKIIDRDVELALSLDLYNTPTYFINGRRVIGNVPYEYLREIVLEELNAAKK